MNTRSPLDASLSPKASPLVPQVKTASLMQQLLQGSVANPLLAAGIGATGAGLAARYAPGAVGRAIRSSPLTVTAAPAIPLGVAGAAGAYGGRFLARNPKGLAAVAGATGTAAVYPHLATPSGITNAFNRAVESTKGMYRDTTGAIGEGYNATTGAIGTGLKAMVDNPMYTAGGLALASLANQGVRSAAGSALGAAGRAITRPGAPRRAAMGAAGIGGLAGSGKLLAPTIGSAGYEGAAEALKGLTSSDLAGLGLGGAALGVLAAQPVRSGLSAAVRGTASGTAGAVGGLGRGAGAASLGTARYLGSSGLTPASLRAALTTGAGLGAGKYLVAPAATDAGYIANALSGLTPLQIGLASAASGAGRYLYPAVRPHAATYMRRRRELAALERLERARAADPREQLKRFLFGAPKEGSYGVSPLHAPLTKTAGSLLDYPGMDKEAFYKQLYSAAQRGVNAAERGAAAFNKGFDATSRFVKGMGPKGMFKATVGAPMQIAGVGGSLLRAGGRQLGRLRPGFAGGARSGQSFLQTPQANAIPTFRSLDRVQQADVLAGGVRRGGLSFLSPTNMYRRAKSRIYSGYNEGRRAEMQHRRLTGMGTQRQQQQALALEGNQAVKDQVQAQATQVARGRVGEQLSSSRASMDYSAPMANYTPGTAYTALSPVTPPSGVQSAVFSGQVGGLPQGGSFNLTNPDQARAMDTVLDDAIKAAITSPNGGIQNVRATLAKELNNLNSNFNNLTRADRNHILDTYLQRRMGASAQTMEQYINASRAAESGMYNRVTAAADDAIAKAVAESAGAMRAGGGSGATSQAVIDSLAATMKANPANYGLQAGDDFGAAATDILNRRAAAAGKTSLDDLLNTGVDYQKLTRDSLTGAGSATRREADRAIGQALEEGTLQTKNLQLAGKGQYGVASKDLEAAIQGRGGALDQVGLPARQQVLDDSTLIKSMQNLDDMSGSASPALRDEVFLQARAAVSTEINSVNKALSSELNNIVRAAGGDAGAVTSAIRRSGALAEVETAIASGRAVDLNAVKTQLQAAGLDAQTLNRLMPRGRTASPFETRILQLTEEASSKAQQAISAQSRRLSGSGAEALGRRTTDAMNRVNEQLTLDASVIGEDVAGLAQNNMKLLQASMPPDAKSQTAALGLIDELAEGLARGDTNAVSRFNNKVTKLRAGDRVRYTTSTLSQGGSVQRKTRGGYIQLQNDALRNFQQGYGELRGATPEAVGQLRTQVAKDPAQLLNDPNLTSALETVTGGTAAQALIKNNRRIAAKIINGETLTLNERAKLVSDAGLTSNLNPIQQQQLSALANGNKLSRGVSAPERAALEQAITNELNTNVTGYQKLRDLDMRRLLEEVNRNQVAFEAYVAAPKATQRGFVDRLRNVAAAGAPPDPRATNYMAAPLSAGVMGGGAYAANATASYGLSALTAPVKGRYTKTAVALDEEALSDPGMSPMEPPVFQPPSAKGDMAALLSMGVLGVGTSEKSSSFMSAPVLSRPAV